MGFYLLSMEFQRFLNEQQYIGLFLGQFLSGPAFQCYYAGCSVLQ